MATTRTRPAAAPPPSPARSAPPPSAHRRFKDAAYGELARVGKALAAPKRLELLELLGQGPRTVEALASEAGASVANTSQHLQVLRAARLVEAEKKGLYVEYRLASDEVGSLYLALRALAGSHLADVEQLTRTYFERRGSLEPIDSAELLKRVRAGQVTVVDARPESEFDAGHLPGAISVPVGELEARLGQIPRGRMVVAYCRGPYCVMAADVAAALKKRGYDAHHLDLGVMELRDRGWRVEKARGVA